MRRFLIFLALLAACPAAQVKDDTGRPRPTAQAFSEPSAVTTVVPVSGGVLVGTSVGLDRWDDAGRRTRLGQSDGIPGLAVKALALDRGQRVWYATDGGVGAYDADTQKSYPIPTSPTFKDHAAVLASVTALAADPSGGVWLGTKSGLYHATAKGEWVNTALKEEVTALLPAAGGALWAGTHDGAVERNQAGVFTRYRQKAGLDIRQVRFIAEGPDGAPVVIGNNDAGKTQIAVFTAGSFSTFRLSNEFAITAATGRSGALALTSPGRLLILYTGVSPIVGLQRNGVHLLPIVGKTKKPPYNVGVFEAPLPADVTAAATTSQRLYVGTRTLGTARFGFDRIRSPPTWLRPGELAAGAIGLFVACRAKSECYVATGGQTAWRYDGNAFAPLTIGGKGNVVLAFVRSPEGQVLALHRQPRERMLHLSRLDDGKFTPVAELKVETPSGATALSFAKFAPDKLLWLGLRYYDEENDPRPYGVAIVDLSLNAVSYHRESADDSKKTGVLPVPNDVVDVAFLEGESWFASGSGAVRLKGNQVKVWSEADDLKSEILRGLVATEGGAVYTASSAGVGEYDGQKWTYPQALAIPTNCIARSEDGRLWLGTDRGLVAYDGKTTDKIDRRAGLLDERVLDVAVDQYSRVWVRTAEGLAVVSD